MAAEDILNLVKLGGRALELNIVRFCDVLAHPRGFVRRVDHRSAKGLVEASLFAVFVSVVNLTIMLPAYRLTSIKADTSTYLLVDTVLTFGFWFLYGSVYHVCAKLVGGRGTYQSSIVAFLYLTAFTVITGILSLCPCH